MAFGNSAEDYSGSAQIGFGSMPKPKRTQRGQCVASVNIKTNTCPKCECSDIKHENALVASRVSSKFVCLKCNFKWD